MSRPRLLLVGLCSKDIVARTLRDLEDAWSAHADVRRHDLESEAAWDPDGADRVVAVGGDGTILQAVRAMGEEQVPVAGVNVGKLGFLAELGREDVVGLSVEALLAMPERRRIMLRCHVHCKGQAAQTCYAVNDAIVAHQDVGRLVRVRVLVSGEEITTYAGDGVIVATPVGSTAYSLSAGGPVVFPSLDVFLLTPVCAHSGGARPMVLPSKERLRLEVVGEPAVLVLDGQQHLSLAPGDMVEVERSPADFHQVILPGRPFYRILREKLWLQGGPNYGS